MMFMLATSSQKLTYDVYASNFIAKATFCMPFSLRKRRSKGERTWQSYDPHHEKPFENGKVTRKLGDGKFYLKLIY